MLPTSVIGGSQFSKVVLKIIRCGGSLSMTLISLDRRMCLPILMNVALVMGDTTILSKYRDTHF